MKERFLFVLAVTVSLLSGCVKQEFFLEGGSIAAVMEDIQTRTAVTDEGTFTWSSGDQVWLEITANPGYVTGTLSSGAGTGSANFSYGTYFGDMTGKAVYPFNSGHDINGDELSVVLPASYDLGTNLSNTNAAMYGVETGGNIKFNHLAGVMRFKFRNAPAGTDRFILTLDKKINGTFTADLTEDHPVLRTESTSSVSEKSITLNFDPLTSAQDIMLYVPLPLGTYTTLGLEVKAGSQSVWNYSNTVTNTINRKSLILMPTVTLAGSISGDIEGSETPEGPDGSSLSINFDTYVTPFDFDEFNNGEYVLIPYNSRSESSGQDFLQRPLEERGGIQVYSFLHNYIEPTVQDPEDTYVDASGISTIIPYMDKVLTWTEDGYWDYPGLTNWPDYSPSRKLAFAAYALNVEDDIEWDEDPNVPANEITGNPEGQSYTRFTYTVPDRVSDQKDLLVAPFLPNQGLSENGEATPVQLNFKHLLSRVGFQVVSNQDSDVDIEIKEVTLHGLFPRKGRVDLKGSGVIDPITTEDDPNAEYVTSYDLFSGDNYFRTTSSTHPVDIYENIKISYDISGGHYWQEENSDPSNRYMMIMPSEQPVTGGTVVTDELPGSYIEVKYQLMDDIVQTARVSLDGWRFEGGKAYNFIFKVSTHSIEFEVSVDSWNEAYTRSESSDLESLKRPVEEYGGMKVSSFLHNYIEPTSAPWGDDIYYGDTYVDVSSISTNSAYIDKEVYWITDHYGYDDEYIDGYWDYVGVDYWPDYSPSRKLAFAAYALNVEDDIEWDEDPNVPANEITGHPEGQSYTKFTYTVPDRVSEQKDLLVTPFLPNQGIDENSNPTPVHLNFKHLLSRVGFQVVANQDSDVEIAIKQVTLHGLFPRKGRVDLRGLGVIDPITTEDDLSAEYVTSYDLFSSDNYFRTTSSTHPVDIYANRQLAADLGSGGYVEFENNDHSNRYMMIIPSQQTSGAYIEVTYQLTGADERTTVLPLDGWRFEAGKAYTFCFVVSPLSLNL